MMSRRASPSAELKRSLSAPRLRARVTAIASFLHALCVRASQAQVLYGDCPLLVKDL